MPNDGGATWTTYGKAFGSSNSWRTKLWISIAICQSRSKYARKEQWQREARWKNQRTAAAVFFRTFGALTEVHFLHTIYHFKALEVKNPTFQTVYDLELKRGRYGLRKTTAPGKRMVCEWCAKFVHPLSCANGVRMVCETRTPPSGVRKLAHPMRGVNFPLFLPTPL